MKPGFWNTCRYPIFGLAPMDGVTDAAFRYITAKYGSPDLMMTEFTSVEGIRAGALRLLDDFYFTDLERPIIAQLFGSDPDAFYTGAVVASALGFDGIDINMGCPAKNVTGHGAGAALILDPERAKAIIRATQAGTKAWNESRTLSDFALHPAIEQEVEKRLHTNTQKDDQELPVSVKTRIGYNEIIIEDWILHLLEAHPVTITIHGRTLKQLYSGLADWGAIGRAAVILRAAGTHVLGNGDIHSKQDALEKISTFGVDGVLIGRATFGNPWLFQEQEVSLTTRLSVALEHAQYFDSIFPPQAFVRMRKHLLDYVKGFDGAKEIRTLLMRASSLQEVESTLLPHLS